MSEVRVKNWQLLHVVAADIIPLEAIAGAAAKSSAAKFIMAFRSGVSLSEVYRARKEGRKERPWTTFQGNRILVKWTQHLHPIIPASKLQLCFRARRVNAQALSGQILRTKHKEDFSVQRDAAPLKAPHIPRAHLAANASAASSPLRDKFETVRGKGLGPDDELHSLQDSLLTLFDNAQHLVNCEGGVAAVSDGDEVDGEEKKYPARDMLPSINILGGKTPEGIVSVEFMWNNFRVVQAPVPSDPDSVPVNVLMVYIFSWAMPTYQLRHSKPFRTISIRRSSSQVEASTQLSVGSHDGPWLLCPLLYRAGIAHDYLGAFRICLTVPRDLEVILDGRLRSGSKAQNPHRPYESSRPPKAPPPSTIISDASSPFQLWEHVKHRHHPNLDKPYLPIAPLGCVDPFIIFLLLRANELKPLKICVNRHDSAGSFDQAVKMVISPDV
ncbi:hypothetical protein K438DRAFT_1753952 [Mycena galopus ATCC 62051]|nr:hypothetical protein K438DRAFT_1753952 [Mycena galopus ATCC 62051]